MANSVRLVLVKKAYGGTVWLLENNKKVKGK